MLKAQYIILVIAAFLVAGLYLLPKVVVENEGRTRLASGESVTAESSMDASHQSEISPTKRQEINQLVAQFERAEESADKLEAANSLFNLYRSVNFFDSAALYLGLFAEQYPEQENLLRAGDAYYDAFQLALSKEKVEAFGEKVRQYYSPVLEQSPDMLALKTKIGMTYVSSANPMQGILMIREVLNQDPDNRLALLNMGMLSMQSGQFDRALGRFEKLVSLEPEDTQARFYLGICYKETGKNEQALKEFEYVKENTDEPEIKANVESYIQEIRAAL